MKRLLYGTTALVSAGMLVSGSAAAAEKISVGVGGYFNGAFAIVDYDNDDGRRDHALFREAEIIFGGSTVLDNGLKVGVQVQLEAETCGDQIDETFVFFSGGWGRINLGSENSAAYLMQYSASAPSHWAFGLQSSNFSVTGAFIHTSPANLSSDSEKLTYFTPRLAGFQFGISYSPDRCEEAQTCGGSYSGTERDDFGDGTIGEVIELGVNYVGNFNDLNLNFSGSYGQADGETGANEDPEEWQVGTRIAYAGLTFGASYRAMEQITGEDDYDWNTGLRYSMGPWGVGIQYAEAQRDRGGDDQDLEAVEVGGSYTLGPGILLFAGVQYWDIDDGFPAGTVGETWTGFLGWHIAY